MDRDRGRDRTHWNSYRPGEGDTRSPRRRRNSRSPPRHRGSRSPQPRGRDAADTYVPGDRGSTRPRSRSPLPFRRRSRTPPGKFRGESQSWRARPRSPPRRGFSPRRDDSRRDDRARSPGRDFRDRARSPPRRERSPLPKRPRSPSPGFRGGRSPPRDKRGRYNSPPRPRRFEDSRSRASSPRRRDPSPPRDDRYRGRSRSPRRGEVGDSHRGDGYRRRSPSPPRPPYRSGQTSGRESGRESVATSRRSSPRPFARNGRDGDRTPRDDRYSPGPRSRQSSVMRDREPEQSPYTRREDSPSRDRDHANGGAPPTGPRKDAKFARAPPTGPAGGSRNFSSPAMSPPSGPASMPMSAHNRSANPVLGAPSRPRGGGGRGFDSGRDYSPRDFSGPPRGRGTGYTPASYGRGGYQGGGPPAGPRGGGAIGYAQGFRGSNNSTSQTYPRTKRFDDHLSDLPQPKSGGQKLPEMYDTTKLNKLEDDLRKMREALAEKEAKRRAGSREWDRLEQESSLATLRADLADQQLSAVNGEGESGGAAF